MDKNEETISLTKCDNSILADEIVSKLANAGIAYRSTTSSTTPLMALTDLIPGLR